MKKIYLILLLTACLLFSCVKDPQSKVDIESIVKVTLNNSDNLVVSTDPAKLYRIKFSLSDDDYIIENGNNIFFSVSSGKLLDPADLSKAANSLTLKIKNKTAEVFYQPGSDPLQNAELIITVDPFTITREIRVKAIEPQALQFEHTVYSVSKLVPLDISVFLKSDSGKVSTNLNVDFSFRKIYKPNSVINLTPATAKSSSDSSSPFTKAAMKVENVMQLADTIMIYAKYKNQLQDSTLIYFHD